MKHTFLLNKKKIVVYATIKGIGIVVLIIFLRIVPDNISDIRPK